MSETFTTSPQESQRITEEHAAQLKEFKTLADNHDRAAENVNNMTLYEGEDDQTFHEVIKSFGEADEASDKLAEKKASVGEFATKHLDVLQKIAIDQAASEGVEINVTSKP